MKNAETLDRLIEELYSRSEAKQEITAEWGASHHFEGQEAPPLDYDFRTSVTQEEAEALVAERGWIK